MSAAGRFTAVFAAAICAAALALPIPARAQTFPALSGPVVDDAQILPPEAEREFAIRLDANGRGAGHQIVVATVPSLQGYEIRDFGNRLFRQWKLGDAQRNDGVLLLVAPADRAVSIEVGYGLEGLLTDAYSKLIIENMILPQFRSGDYAAGVRAGIDGIIAVVGGKGETLVQETQTDDLDPSDLDPSETIFFFIFLGIVIFIVWRALRGRQILVGGPGGGGWSSGSSRGFGGGSSGGGFSGGGGSSGGGGASGRW
jgi:uncharacterized protein